MVISIILWKTTKHAAIYNNGIDLYDSIWKISGKNGDVLKAI